MKITIDVKKNELVMEPETIADGFKLGELWGAHTDDINVAWGCNCTLHFRLLPVPKNENGGI